MPPTIRGLHHVTATVAGAQEDLDFHARALGLRLVKKTVNFDNPSVYHLYYGDREGRPSSLMTTFPYAGKGVRPGTIGAGQITRTSFSVPPGALDFWRERLAAAHVATEDARTPFDEPALRCEDPSGLRYELAEAGDDAREGWIAPGVEPAAAIRGLHRVTLLVRDPAPSIDFAVSALGFEVVERASDRVRLAAGEAGPGAFVDIAASRDAPAAVNGLGTVHHVAFAIRDEAAQLEARRELVERGARVTDVRDRQYFRSIYFREPGGILYEIATEGPGFLIDESVDDLGGGLRLPDWEEPNRREIEATLTPLSQER